MKKEEIFKYFDKLIKEEIAEDKTLTNLKDYNLFTFLCLKYYFFSNDIESNDDIIDSIVDGTGDNSIDAICNNPTVEELPIVFIQTKYCKDFDLTKAKGEIVEIEESLKAYKKHKYKRFNENVLAKIEDCLDKSENQDNFEIAYFTSAVVRQDTKRKFVDFYKEKPHIQIFFGDDIQNYIIGEKEKSGRIKNGKLEIDSPNNQLIYDDSIMVNISALSLKILYREYSRALLGLNLRYYIRNKRVDTGLKDTINNNPNNFWYLNNGIVITCDEYSVDGKIITLKSFSIINGGQTTEMIYKTDFDSDFFIPCKIIKVPQEGSTEKSITNEEIAIATNSQKPIKAKDLVSNKQEQIELKAKLKQLNIQYITKNGETIDNRFKDKNKHINIDRLGKLGLFAIMQKPEARNNSSILYDESKKFYHQIYKQTNPKLFVDLLKLDNYYKSFIRRKEIASTNPKLTRNARTYALAAITYCSYYYQNNELFNNNWDLSSSQYKTFIKKLMNLDSIIVNKIDDEEKQYIKLFIIISNEIFDSVYRKAKAENEDLPESNFFKKEKTYSECITQINSNLINEIGPLHRICKTLFKQDKYVY
ncbi:MAG: AIPR family protein [Sphaerochaetaceae bacterium]|nr:AIPR family protein [Sphaerochaetaceae bacterium]